MGTRIRTRREALGISQAALAKRARITREYVNKLEAGRYDPTIGVITLIAKALGVKISDLVD